MIEKLKMEPYIKESLCVRLFESGGKLIAERYDTICWVKESFPNVECSAGLDCFVEAKKFCGLHTLVKDVSDCGGTVKLLLFNGAEYDLDKLDPGVEIPHFDVAGLKHKGVFDFGGVEKAVSKSDLQKDLNTVYADSAGIVASSSIVGAVCGDRFKSDVAFAVPEVVSSLVGGEDVEWDISDGKLFVKFGVVDLVCVLSSLPEFAWWDSVRDAFDGVDFSTGVVVTGLRSSVARLSSFGTRVTVNEGKIFVDDGHWEPIGLFGTGEVFDVGDLLQVLSDDASTLVLSGGNLYFQCDGVKYVVCSVDVQA